MKKSILSHKIEDPFAWDGHEVEALLATQSGYGSSKELLAVTVIRTEGEPEAFYRVKEAGEKPADFKNWLEAVDYYNCIGGQQIEEDD